MEAKRWRFALCGSSARKLRRGGANMFLPGRALTLAMESFPPSSLEGGIRPRSRPGLGIAAFRPQRTRNRSGYPGGLCQIVSQGGASGRGAYPQCPAFRALSGRGRPDQRTGGECPEHCPGGGRSRTTVDTYFSILTDTLLGHRLPAWRPGLKVREAAQPKFYWFDSGVARAAAGLLRDPADRLWQGYALETLIYHELRVYNEISGKQRPLSYYRTPGGRGDRLYH